MITIDGSYLEGGGQIIRTALALSMYTQRPFKVDNIRQGRPKPGLKAQHLSCIKALLKLTNDKAKAIGAELGSTSLEFYPAKITKSKIEIDIGTSGSITLLLQSLLLPLIFHGKATKLKIIGGTDTKWSPLFDYFREIIISSLSGFAKFEINLLKRGFYPKGGGIVEIRIKPHKLDVFPELSLIEQGDLLHISGKSFASQELMNANVAERQAESASRTLKEKLNKYPHINIELEYNNSLSIGSGVVLWALFKSKLVEETVVNVRLGSDVLGEKGKKSEKIGEEAAVKLISEINSDCSVDVHLADNLIPFLGVVGGQIKTSSISNHTLTNISTTEKFLDKKFDINKEKKIIKC